MKFLLKVKEKFFNFLKDYSLKSDVNIKNSDLEKINFDFNIEEKRSEFGDFSVNAPIFLGKILKKSPIQIGKEIQENFSDFSIERIELAGVGFLNFYLKDFLYKNFLNESLKNKIFIEKTKNPKKYNIEFVSANPTGPLHIGHGRGGIIGGVLANVLEKIGHSVDTEFFINDAGVQMQKLGYSIKSRYEELLGKEINFSSDWYQGEYIVEIAKEILKKYKDKCLEKDWNFFSKYGEEILLKNIKDTLAKYGIFFKNWFSEKNLHQSGSIDEVLKKLEKNNFLYESDGSIWFKSTNWGDDKDRVVKKSNGELTYISADIAYLENKLNRGYDKLIMILGQDHHSYKARLKASLNALGFNEEKLSVILYQLVTIKKSGEQVKLSKRAGNIILLEDIINSVGKDVARFFYLNKKADAHLDFDFDLAIENSSNNPVYYIQYSIVRMKSILRKYKEIEFKENKNEKRENIEYSNIEKMILRKIDSIQDLFNKIEENYEIHLITYFTYELASLFHNFYTKNQCLIIDNKELTENRVKLVELTLFYIEELMKVLGMDSPDIM